MATTTTTTMNAIYHLTESTATVVQQKVGTIMEHIENGITVPEFVINNRYGTYFVEVIVPSGQALWYRLEVPEYRIYKLAISQWLYDMTRTIQSTSNVVYILCKPICILFWILLQYLYKHVLVEHGGRNLYKGWVHTKYAIVWLVRYQCSLSQYEVVLEVGVIGFCILSYYFYVWLQQQTYWSRFVQWYTNKKHACVQAYTDTVHKVARVSKLLAMAVPHIMFVGVCVGILYIFPNGVNYVTYETPLVAVISVWYPFIGTFLWVNKQRNNNDTDNITNNSTKMMNGPSSSSSPSSEVTVLSSSMDTIKTTNYWLNYWHMYAIIHAFGHCFTLIPVVGRFVVQHPVFYYVTGELKLVFFLWVFSMERILSGITLSSSSSSSSSVQQDNNKKPNSNDDLFLLEALPLRLWKRYITPSIMRLHTVISDAVPKDVWEHYVVSKIKTVLGAFVMIRILSEPWKDWLVHVIEESRVLTVPSITLLMPGFITQIGATYVQCIVPSAKCADPKNGQPLKLVYLQYWILHCIVSGLLSYFTTVLWWIPFSSHVVFILWSYLVLPQTIRNLYSIIESELIAFGLLKRSGGTTTKTEINNDGDEVDDSTDEVLPLNETRTGKFISAIIAKLPIASFETYDKEEDDDDDEDSSNNSSDDGTENITSVGNVVTAAAADITSTAMKKKEKNDNNEEDHNAVPSSSSSEQHTDTATTKGKNKVRQKGEEDGAPSKIFSSVVIE